jgi:hypothetical protein
VVPGDIRTSWLCLRAWLAPTSHLQTSGGVHDFYCWQDATGNTAGMVVGICTTRQAPRQQRQLTTM